jgi:hypothetical protein
MDNQSHPLYIPEGPRRATRLGFDHTPVASISWSPSFCLIAFHCSSLSYSGPGRLAHHARKLGIVRFVRLDFDTVRQRF